jgi:hypothetical protein
LSEQETATAPEDSIVEPDAGGSSWKDLSYTVAHPNGLVGYQVGDEAAVRLMGTRFADFVPLPVEQPGVASSRTPPLRQT